MPEPGDVIHGVVMGSPFWAICRNRSGADDGYSVEDIHLYPFWDSSSAGHSHVMDREMVCMDDPEPTEPPSSTFREWLEQMMRNVQDQSVPLGDIHLPAVDPAVFEDSYTITHDPPPEPYRMFMHPAELTRLVDAGILPPDDHAFQVTRLVDPPPEIAMEDVIARTQDHLADVIASGEVGQVFGVQMADNPPARHSPPRRRRIRRPRRRG